MESGEKMTIGEHQPKQREPEFDIMKGIAILFVVVGHMEVYFPYWLHTFIYSFHMPLFFLLSGYFFNEKSTIKKDIRRLLIPYALTIVSIAAFAALRALMKHDLTFLTSNSKIFDNSVWFLLALFWARMVYRWLPKGRWINLLYCFAITVVSLLYKKSDFYYDVPLFLIQGLAAVVFIGIGHYVRRYGIPWWMVVACIVCWVWSILNYRIELYMAEYDFFLVTMPGAVGGTIVIYWISKLIASYTKIISIALQWCGKNSMLILCVHSFDLVSPYWNRLLNGVLHLKVPELGIVLIRHSMMLLFSYLLSLMSVVRNLFGGGPVAIEDSSRK